MVRSTDDVNIYFVTIPAHRFLHIRNYESNGYWDFWQKQALIPGRDYETVCGILDSIKGKLNDAGGSGQIMGYINDPQGRLCDWGIPRIECWGVRLPPDYRGEAPPGIVWIRPPAESCIFITTPSSISSMSGRCAGFEKYMEFFWKMGKSVLDKRKLR